MRNVNRLYESLLAQLHCEMKKGCGEGEQADWISDEMNYLWTKLDEQSMALFDELSEDLFILEGKRVVIPLEEGETIEHIREHITDSLKNRQYQEVLLSARKLVNFDPNLFGHCWEHLGFSLGASLFYEVSSKNEEYYDHDYCVQTK